MALHPKMVSRAAETKKVYEQKRNEPAFKALPPRERLGVVARQVSANLKGK